MSRYDSLRNISRNEALYEYYLLHPDKSYEEIGRIFLKPDGKPLSKQAVFQIKEAEEERLEEEVEFKQVNRD